MASDVRLLGGHQSILRYSRNVWDRGFQVVRPGEVLHEGGRPRRRPNDAATRAQRGRIRKEPLWGGFLTRPTSSNSRSTLSQDANAYLSVLHAAIGRHGSPKAIATDGGAIFHLRAELARRDYDDQGTPTHDHAGTLRDQDAPAFAEQLRELL